jgi:HAAS domain-containing protein
MDGVHGSDAIGGGAVIEGWLARFAASLRVHGRRRRRILDELEEHLRESAAAHGERDAIERVGDPHAVAASFTPRAADRLYEQRDRVAAAALLAAMAACIPLAVELRDLGRDTGSSAWVWFFAFLAPTAVVAAVSAVAVLGRRRLGARLARLLAVMVAVTAVVVVLDLPPARGEFSQYRSAVRAGHHAAACTGRTPASCADDHAWEIRVNYSAGALLLAGVYLWAVTGWAPRRPRRLQTA